MYVRPLVYPELPASGRELYRALHWSTAQARRLPHISIAAIVYLHVSVFTNASLARRFAKVLEGFDMGAMSGNGVEPF